MVIQGGEDPTLFLESLPYSSQWNVGPVNRDNLAATAYARVRQPYIARFRTIPLPASAVVGAKNVSILLPESLQVMLSCYLRIELPELTAGATYRKFVGARILREIRVLSAGQQVMSCDFRDVMTDYLTNLERSAYESFVNTHLGGRATESATARTILLPIPLWNSAIFARSHTGHLGAIPAAGFANNRLEFILDFADSRDLTVNNSAVAAFSSITMEIHEALMPSSAMRAYARQNGNYSASGPPTTRSTPRPRPTPAPSSPSSALPPPGPSRRSSSSRPARKGPSTPWPHTTWTTSSSKSRRA